MSTVPLPDPADPQEKAARLLDAQIDYLLAVLGPDGFTGLVEAEVDHALATLGTLAMESLVSREDVKAVARKYATSLTLPGSIPVLAGEIVRRIFRDPAQDRYRIGDLFDGGELQAFVEKLLELPGLHQGLVASPITVSVLAARMHGLIHRAVAENRRVAELLPGASRLLDVGEGLLQRASPGGLREIDARLAELSEVAARRVLAILGDAPPSSVEPSFAEAVAELLEDNAERPVGSLRDYVSPDDLEDLLVLGYEFWLRFRQTEYLRSLIDAGIDFVFDKYGEVTLRELLDEFGIGREDLIEEALRFGPPALEVLRGNGMLAGALRRHLAPFFASDEVRDLLSR